MRWSFIKKVLLLLFCLNGMLSAGEWSGELRRMGMENIREADREEGCYLSWEDPVYRGSCRGLAEVIRLVAQKSVEAKDFYLIIQENRIPQILVRIPGEELRQYRLRQSSWEALVRSAEITWDTDEAVRALKEAGKTEYASAGRVDIVLYPQLRLRNAWLDKIYGASVNIAPAVEVALWKGAYFTGQVIFPVWNNLEGEADYIRAGMVTLRQDIRLPKRWSASVGVGNFDRQRIGADARLEWRTADDRWKIGVRGGLTGASVFYGGKWKVSRWERLTGAASVRYYEPTYNLEMELTGERYIYGDYGGRVDLVRHFGEVSIGLFAMYSGGEANGGFSFSVPMPRKKRFRRGYFRVRLPEYWGLGYEAQSGNAYAERRLGRRYETRPEESRSAGFYNPDFVREELLRF